MIVTGELVSAYVQSKVGTKFPMDGSSRAMGLVKGNRIVAGAVFSFSSHTPGGQIDDVEITVASERGAMTRKFLRAMGEYIRDQVGLWRVSITTAQPSVAQLAMRLGAQLECEREIRPGEFIYLLGITKKTWKF